MLIKLIFYITNMSLMPENLFTKQMVLIGLYIAANKS